MKIDYKKDPPTILEIYKVHREQIELESNNVNQKVIWLAISQSFFFTAYTALLNAPEKAKDMLFSSLQSFMIKLVPIAGLAVSLIMLPSMIESLIYTHRAGKRYKETMPQAEYLPPVHKDHDLRVLGYLTPLLLPIFFVLLWCTLIAISFGKAKI
jgi:hypothetical protein